MNDLNCIRSDFPSLSRTEDGFPLAFFDGPGGSQVPNSVIDAISFYYRNCNANTHGAFITSLESDQMIEEARTVVARFLNAPGPENISFGANMTSLNFALSHAIQRSLVAGDEVLITQLDHEANRGPWLGLRRKGILVREVRMLPDGKLDYEDLSAKVNHRTRLVAVGWASNALGTVNDLRLIRRVTRDVNAWLIVDAVHYAPHFPIDVLDFEIDFLLCSAYKFYGPHVGILYTRSNLLGQFDTDRLRTQDSRAPYRIETGTLNHAAISGVKAALEYLASLSGGETLRGRLLETMRRLAAHEHELGSKLFEELGRVPGVNTFGPVFQDQRAPTIAFVLEGFRPSEVAGYLARKGLLVWDGDFYAARAVEVLGLADKGGLVRVGMSIYNSREELDRLVGAISELAARQA